MEPCHWLTNTVVTVGTEGRRWLASKFASKNDDSAIATLNDQFSESDQGVLTMHMNQMQYILEVLYLDSKRQNTIWVGDGQNKIRAMFTKKAVPPSKKRFRIEQFDVVINPAEKPESRVTLNIHEYLPTKAGPLQNTSAIASVEHEPAVQKLIRALRPFQDRRQSVCASASRSVTSPVRPQQGETTSPSAVNFGTQVELSTQLPKISAERRKLVVAGSSHNERPYIKNDLQSAVKNNTTLEMKAPQNELLKLLENSRPKRAAPIKIDMTKVSATLLQTRHGGGSEAYQVEVHKNQQRKSFAPVESESSLKLHLSTATEPAESSTPPPVDSKTTENQNVEEPHTKGDLNDADNADFLADGEQEKGQQISDCTNLREGVPSKALQVSDGDTHENGLCLEDHPFKGMKKIPSNSFKIPRDQQDILDSMESWVTPSVPESVIQERRNLQHNMLPMKDVTVPNPSGDSKSVASEDNSEECSESEEPGIPSEYQASPKAADDQVYEPFCGRQEPRRSYTLEPAEAVDQLGNASSAPGSPNSFSRSSVVSWSSSPSPGPQIHQEAEEIDVDRSTSVDPDSNLPEPCSETTDPVVVKKLVTPKIVQVTDSNLLAENEDEDEEDMEMGEPSALGSETPAKSLPSQTAETVLRTPKTYQHRAVVEVERTPQFKVSSSKGYSQITERVRSIDHGVCSSVVPGTAEECLLMTNLGNTIAVPSTGESGQSSSQSSDPSEKVEPSSNRHLEPPSNQESPSIAQIWQSKWNSSKDRISKTDPCAALPSTPHTAGEAPSSSVPFSSMGSDSAPTKRTASQAELDDSRPSAKKRNSLPERSSDNFPLSSQCSVDLRKLKKSHRDNFIRENNPLNRPRQNGIPEKPLNVYERFCEAYPSFGVSVNSFVLWCVYIDWLSPKRRLMPTQYDDFVHKVARGYPDYCALPRTDPPLSAIDWYMDQGDLVHEKRLLDRGTLQEALALNPGQTVKIHEKLQKSVSKKKEAATKMPDPIPKLTTFSATKIPDPMPRLVTFATTKMPDPKPKPTTSAANSATRASIPGPLVDLTSSDDEHDIAKPKGTSQRKDASREEFEKPRRPPSSPRRPSAPSAGTASTASRPIKTEQQSIPRGTEAAANDAGSSTTTKRKRSSVLSSLVDDEAIKEWAKNPKRKRTTLLNLEDASD